MIKFKAEIRRFEKQGEKTGWSYIEIPSNLAVKLKPGERKSFRVMGRLDAFEIEQVALIPMGEGNFILPVNSSLRKGTGKGEGDTLLVELKEDPRVPEIDPEFLDCLEYDPVAKEMFDSLPRGHQNYFSRWIQSAKTEKTRGDRIAEAVSALSQGMGYAEMIRARKVR